MLFVGGIGFAGKSTLVSSTFIVLLRRIVVAVLVFSTFIVGYFDRTFCIAFQLQVLMFLGRKVDGTQDISFNGQGQLCPQTCVELTNISNYTRIRTIQSSTPEKKAKKTITGQSSDFKY